MDSILTSIYEIVWGAPLLALITLVGLIYTLLLRGIQFRLLPQALRLAFSPKMNQGQMKAAGDISHFQALMTALAATMGIGNIAGVATAITMGGFGSIFWMWATALLGMAIKYAEAILAIMYRGQDSRGLMSGGPMYFIRDGLHAPKLAASFALFGIMAAFGGGNMIQAHSVGHVVDSVFHVSPFITAALLALLTAITIIGGIQSIGRVASILVPFMALFYIAGAAVVIFCFFDQVPRVLCAIFEQALMPKAAAGGVLGAGVAHAIQIGLSRGLMTSEAGLGTASIAAAAAKTEKPMDQALVSMSGAFLATVVMCSVTALAIGVTSVAGTADASGAVITGAALTTMAFERAMPYFGSWIVSISLILFAFTTLLGWSYYGEQCAEYLFGERAVPLFRALFVAAVFVGGIMALETVWKISDIMNGLMALPNLLALLFLAPQVVRETKRDLEPTGS